MKTLLKVLVFIVIMGILGVVGMKLVKKAREKEASMKPPKIYPIVVSKMTPKFSQVRLTLPYLAVVENDKDVNLASRIAARVEKIVRSGEKVKKGEVVVKLDTTDIKSSISSVKNEIKANEINLKNLLKTHKRTLELLKVKGASIEQSEKEESLIAKTKATLLSLKDKLKELKNALTYATIISPVDGVVTKTFVSEGAISAPGKPLLRISAKNGFYLLVRVPADIPVKSIIFKKEEFPAVELGSTFHGLKEYKVYVDDSSLVSGDRVEVDVVTFKDRAILLPFDAVLSLQDKNLVLEIDGGQAKPKRVHIVQSGEQGIVVKENIEGKNIVVAKPDIMLRLLSGYPLIVKE